MRFYNSGGGSEKKMNKKELLENIPELAKLSKLYSNIYVLICGTDSRPFMLRAYEQGFTEFFPYSDMFINNLIYSKDEEILYFDYTMTTGKLINYLIRKNHITSAELSKAIGVAPSSVSRWISGNARISDDNLLKLSAYFDVSPEYLKGEHCMKTHKEENTNKKRLQKAIDFVNNYMISNSDKEILKECGYYPIDIYANREYYDSDSFDKIICQPIEIYEHQQIDENTWILWRYKVSLYSNLPKKILLVSIEELEKMGFPYWSIKEHIEYSQEIKNIAHYVDYEKLKILIEDRKNLLSFNFEKSLENIK